MERKNEKKTKKILLIIMMLAGTFLFLGRVFAAESDECSYTLLNDMKQAAANIKVTYVPGEEKEVGTDEFGNQSTFTNNFLDLKIYNVTSQMYLMISQRGENIYGNTFGPIGYDQAGPDGAITLRQNAAAYIVTYTIDVFGNYNACTGQKLRSIKITLPKYNQYSQLLACDGISDYYLCHEYTTYEIDGATFYDKVDDYKSKLLTSQEGIESTDNNTMISKTFNGISKYRYLIVGVIVAIGVVATVVVLKRKKGVE
jgi:hypothetical protein